MIQDVCGFAEPTDAEPVNMPHPRGVPDNVSAQQPQDRGCVEDVFAFQQARDGCPACRQCAQYEGTVGNRLVAGHAQSPLEGAR